VDGGWLDTAERISRMASIAALPIILAIGGWVIQRQLQNRTVSRDYVQLALTILQNPDQSKVAPELREWAVELLNANSPTKLNAKAIDGLKSGTVTLPSFNFVPSRALTPQLRTELERSLRAFQSYLADLGFPNATGPVSVEISPEIPANGGVASWDPSTAAIFVASAFAGDKTSVLRQLAHKYLYTADSESPECLAIESGLATYFPCSFLDHPMMGDQATAAGRALLPPQDLRNERSFKEIRLNDNASIQNDGSEIWGGALWQVRQLLGRDRADRLLAETWRALGIWENAGRRHAYVTFVGDLVERVKVLGNGKEFATIRAAFVKRGLRF